LLYSAVFVDWPTVDKYGSLITAMALINPGMSGSQIFNLRLKEFLHQRARQWKVAGSLYSPYNCIEVPSRNLQELEILDSSMKGEPAVAGNSAEPSQFSGWLQTISSPRTMAAVAGFFQRLTLSVQVVENNSTGTQVDPSNDMDPLCPTFADDENPHGAGECVFTSPKVQRCVLEFFEEVARDPSNYRK
jgi:hypothetical protein